jgi:hypothetical protein
MDQNKLKIEYDHISYPNRSKIECDPLSNQNLSGFRLQNSNDSVSILQVKNFIKKETEKYVRSNFKNNY